MNRTGNQLFQSELNKNRINSRKTATKSYHDDVVAQVFNKGFSTEIKSKELTQKANQVYILTNRVVNSIKENGYSVDSFYLNIFHENPQVIVAVNNEFLIKDDFVTQIYSKVFEMKRIFNELFSCALDMGIMGAKDIDIEALRADGFEYSEDFTRIAFIYNTSVFFLKLGKLLFNDHGNSFSISFTGKFL